MKRKVIVLAIVAVLALVTSGCKYASGPYAAKDGIVLCMISAVDVAAKTVPQAHGGNSGRYASCNGDAYTSPQLTMTVHLFHVEAIVGGLVISRACGSSGPVTLGQTSGFTITTSGIGGCAGANIGDLFYAEGFARGYIGGSYYESAVQKSPMEQWTLPGAVAGESERVGDVPKVLLELDSYAGYGDGS
jgi:hypothetical protein